MTLLAGARIAAALVVASACQGRGPRPTSTDQAPAAPPAQSPPPDNVLAPYIEWNLPSWVHDALRTGGYAERYELFTGLNPHYQRGRFDSDDKSDIAVTIREKRSGKRGIAIIHRSNGAVHIIGAGEPFGNGGDDFSWLGVWWVVERDVTGKAAAPSRDILVVEKPEAAGAIISWDGTKYIWKQEGRES